MFEATKVRYAISSRMAVIRHYMFIPLQRLGIDTRKLCELLYTVNVITRRLCNFVWWQYDVLATRIARIVACFEAFPASEIVLVPPSSCFRWQHKKDGSRRQQEDQQQLRRGHCYWAMSSPLSVSAAYVVRRLRRVKYTGDRKRLSLCEPFPGIAIRQAAASGAE